MKKRNFNLSVMSMSEIHELKTVVTDAAKEYDRLAKCDAFLDDHFAAVNKLKKCKQTLKLINERIIEIVEQINTTYER